jgi:hypothetical protein
VGFIGQVGMTVASKLGMSPLVLSGAASVANLLISGVSNALTPSVAPSSVKPAPAKGFDHALYKAAGSGVVLPSAARPSSAASGLDLQRSAVLELPEVQAAISRQPAGSVTGVEVREDGSAALCTFRGPVEVALSPVSRASVARAVSSIGELAESLRFGNGQSAVVNRLMAVPSGAASEADGFSKAPGFIMPLSGASLA